MHALFIGQSYIDITFLTDRIPTGDEKTAQQKLTGLVIGGLPIGVGLLFQVMQPGYIGPLFTTLTGQALLVAAVVMEVIGILIIQRILNIEV